MEFQYFKLIFLFVISQQCDLLNVEDSIQISSGGAIITIEQNVSDYLIHYVAISIIWRCLRTGHERFPLCLFGHSPMT